MPRGLPDYYNPDTVLAAKMIDMGQVLTGVIGVNTVDGRGRIVWYDNFREGVGAWIDSSSGDATPVVATTVHCEIPPCAMRLSSGTSGGAGDGKAYFQLRLGQPYRMACEFTLYATTDDVRINLYMVYSTTGGGKRGMIVIYPSTGLIQISTGGGLLNLTNIDMSAMANAWIPVKFVMDVPNDKYLRVMIGGQEISIPLYSLYATADTFDETAWIVVEVLGQDGADHNIYIGHTFITLDEP